MRAYTTRTARLAVILHAVSLALADVTVYFAQGQLPLSATQTAVAANYTGAAAYNPTVLNPPPPPSPPIATQFAVPLQNAVPQGASIAQSGSFFGFSIEMSVANQVLGLNASFIQVPFLNLMSNLAHRSGRVRVRVGGNTQDSATLVASTPDGKMLEKNYANTSGVTNTPPLIFTNQLLYMMSNISALVPVDWFLGVPFNDTQNFRLAIAEQGEQIIGSNLIGLQVGNEPDLYVNHGRRPSTYGPSDYVGEFGSLVQVIEADNNIPQKSLLIGPNIDMNWLPQQIWDTGFIDTYSANLAFLAVERYPTDNCAAQFNVGIYHDPQATFPSFLTHQSGQSIAVYYQSSTALAQTKGKEMLMFETNTASCGGFPGISDSFGAALWGIDYALQLAYYNFSTALFHVGGQNVFYNPFTPPPTNQSTFRQWTIGPIYYSALVVAEALGNTNTSQVLDLFANNNNQFTPGYVIYENGAPARVLLINYITDPSGQNNLSIGISIGGGNTGQPSSTPASVKVKYLLASSVSQKGNFTWANQTFGMNFGSDGRFQGTENVVTIQCDQTAQVCTVPLPAPGVALVFLTDSALTNSDPTGSTSTYATTAYTRTGHTVQVDPSVLATSNGHTGMNRLLGSTSKGSTSAAQRQRRGLRDAGVLAIFIGVVGGLLAGTLFV